MKESIQSMPIRVDDAECLADLANDEFQLLIGDPTHVDLNVQDIVRRKFGADSPGNDI